MKLCPDVSHPTSIHSSSPLDDSRSTSLSKAPALFDSLLPLALDLVPLRLLLIPLPVQIRGEAALLAGAALLSLSLHDVSLGRGAHLLAVEGVGRRRIILERVWMRAPGAPGSGRGLDAGLVTWSAAEDFWIVQGRVLRCGLGLGRCVAGGIRGVAIGVVLGWLSSCACVHCRLKMFVLEDYRLCLQ